MRKEVVLIIKTTPFLNVQMLGLQQRSSSANIVFIIDRLRKNISFKD